MKRKGAGEPDRFRQMLVWSLVLHGLLFSAVALAASLGPRASALPPPVATFMNVSLGQSGPITGAGGGATEAKPKPPDPAPPPEEKPPTVVRPTKEVREEIPDPDARPAKKVPEPKPDSGLRGADAASAASAQLAPGGPNLPGLGLGGSGGGSPFDQDFEYAYYVQQMLARIHQRWQRTAVKGTAVVIVRFTIERNGHILDAAVETSSGISILDRSSLRAVMLADPLPPLPNSYPRDQVGVHLRFTYTDQL